MPATIVNPPAPADLPKPGARSALALLLAINLFNYIDRYVLAAVEPEIRKTFFAGDSENAMAKTGLLATAFLVAYMLTAPIFGWLADRMSRWLLIGAAVLVWSLATGASGLAATFAMLLFTRVLVGVGEAGYGPAAPTLIADLYPLRRRGAVLAWFYAAIPVGSALGYALGGFLALHFGWRWAFLGVVAPGLLLGVLCLFRRDQNRHATGSHRRPGPQIGDLAIRHADDPTLPPPGEQGGAALFPAEQAPAHPRESKANAPIHPAPDVPAPARGRLSLADYRTLLSNPSYLLDTAGMTALTFAIGGISYWMPAYLVARRAGDLATVNMRFGAIVVVAGLAATLAGGWIADHLRDRLPGAYFLVSAAGLLAACPLIVAMLYAPFPAAWWLIAAAVFCLFFNTGPSNTILANVTTPAIRAGAFALNILLIHALGDALAPALLGHIVGPTRALVAGQPTLIHHWNAAFALVAALTAIGGTLWLLGARFLQSDTQKASRTA